jgi:signal transduction histidine kinase
MASGSILLVDDEENVLVTMQAVLELDGYQVAIEQQGSQALERVRRETFDLVLTDLRLDDLDGMAILAAVRRESPDTIVILLTGYASLESAVTALRQGAYDYLVKPCDVEELRATVARGIERRQLTLALQERVRELEAANETIRVLNSGLQRRVDEATAELSRRLEELATARDEIAALYGESQQHVERLRELDQLKSQFLSIASHELKTPLTALSGFVQMMLRRVRKRMERGQPSPEEWRHEQQAVVEQMEVVDQQARKLGRLVDDLLDVSRIQSGRVTFDFAPVDLLRLAQEVAGRMQLITAEHQIDVRAGPGAVTLSADRDQLEQVLNNLLANAIKYSPEGGSILVELRPTEDEMILSVRDQGVGIAAAERENIFDLFYRSQKQRGSRVGGMGVGLYISREIVSRHGGRIWVESEAGAGSTFYVALPWQPSARPAAVAS